MLTAAINTIFSEAFKLILDLSLSLLDIGILYSCTRNWVFQIHNFSPTLQALSGSLEQLAKLLKSMEVRRVGLILHS